MIIRCLDFETTGLPTEDKPTGIMETGWCDLSVDDGRITGPEGHLVNPGIPTSIEARAVHHISDADVERSGIAPTKSTMLLMEGEHSHFCSHNIDMEKAYFGGGDREWVCTYKTALRIWPDAPGHKLQELRYFLGIDDEPDFDPGLTQAPHRAPDDAYVCAFVLRRLLASETLDVLVRWSNGPALLAMCWMKKHKGKTWQKVAYEDRPYLEWIYNVSDVKDRDIRATVKYWLNKTATN